MQLVPNTQVSLDAAKRGSWIVVVLLGGLGVLVKAEFHLEKRRYSREIDTEKPYSDHTAVLFAGLRDQV